MHVTVYYYCITTSDGNHRYCVGLVLRLPSALLLGCSDCGC